MSKVCQLTGKRPVSGHNVSHSNRKTKRRFVPNLQKKRFYIPESDKWVTLRVTTSAIRAINKIGITAYIQKCQRKGTAIDIEL